MKRYYYVKRILDIIIGLILLIAALPLFLLISILIKLDSKGPVFFVQDRLGQHGKVFKIIKFRTMVLNAINLGDGLRTYEGDKRITKIGSILRKTSLDELPQVINILKGEMSFVGPRPPVPYHPRKYEEYDDVQKQRFLLKPGITGYAQVMVRNSVTWDERIKYDIEYCNNLSFIFDLKIILRTFVMVIKRKNIYYSKQNLANDIK